MTCTTRKSSRHVVSACSAAPTPDRGSTASSPDGGTPEYPPSIRKNGGTPFRKDGDTLSLVRKDGGTPLSAGSGYPPPPKVGQTNTCENITSRHPSDAGGKYSHLQLSSKFIHVLRYSNLNQPDSLAAMANSVRFEHKYSSLRTLKSFIEQKV